MTKDNSIPIFSGGDVPQFLLILSQSVAKGSIENLSVVYTTKNGNVGHKMMGDSVVLSGLLARAMIQLTTE